MTGLNLRYMRTTVRAAFSMIELLVVMAIMAVLAAVAVPAVSHTLRASKLTSAGQLVVDELNLARQTAKSRNAPVEVRFYKLPDHDKPSAAPSIYRGMQTFLVSGASILPIDGPKMFPAPVVISSGTAESPFLSSNDHPEEGAFPGIELPGYGDNYRYRSFTFTPGGSADLEHPDNCLTLVLQNDKAITDGSNYFAIQVNPISGAVRSFRP